MDCFPSLDYSAGENKEENQMSIIARQVRKFYHIGKSIAIPAGSDNTFSTVFYDMHKSDRNRLRSSPLHAYGGNFIITAKVIFAHLRVMKKMRDLIFRRLYEIRTFRS